ncbi:MAG: hypothetical protein JSW39_03935 [Desulfobacterales bacterium]|nr:MAG: hypothetical protein JSW39_03935 [Desulfobacterales bacterium]
MMDAKLEEQEVTLVGFVYELEERGEVRGVAISTGEEDYLVEMNEQGKKLLKEIENDVEVTGIVTKGANGKNRITVKGFEVLHLEDAYNDNYDSKFDYESGDEL